MHPAVNAQKIKIVATLPFAILTILFPVWVHAGSGETALKFASVWRRAGHNNIKSNPVFRGMP